VVTGEAFAYGFMGERQDPATGLVYLRARHYDPATGRFLTPDRVDFQPRDPRTLHRYLYALGNPLNRTDRTGEFSLVEINITTAIQGILAAIRQVYLHCIRQRLTLSIFESMAMWAVNGVVGMMLQGIMGAIASAVAGPIGTELVFHQAIAKFLCGDLSIGSWYFMVKVDDCGIRRRRRRDGSFWKFYECVANIVAMLKDGETGIDISFEDMIPIELKLDHGTVDNDQLERFCMYAANRGTHVAIWAYAFWSDHGHVRNGIRCFFAPLLRAGRCAGRGVSPIGSIYVAIGQRGGRFHAYVPDPDVCSLDNLRHL
jgi:RHS repeat-associated protein